VLTSSGQLYGANHLANAVGFGANYLVLPKTQDGPTELAEPLVDGTIPPPISLYFLDPKMTVLLERRLESSSPTVPVPEIAVAKDGYLRGDDCEVGLAGQGMLLAVADSSGPQRAAHGALDLRARCSDTRHLAKGVLGPLRHA
jgi:hypothetical protein